MERRIRRGCKNVKKYFINFFRSSKSVHMRNIWNKYDDDHSGKMDLKEFIEFVREMNP